MCTNIPDEECIVLPLWPKSVITIKKLQFMLLHTTVLNTECVSAFTLSSVQKCSVLLVTSHASD